MLVDYYAQLEVERGADENAVKKSYRKLVLKYHPDKNPDDRDAAEEKIREINTAYEVLSNPAKRNAFLAQVAALETKSVGVRLDTSRIQPRMAIPKHFMLCPMGHPEKFMRNSGGPMGSTAAFHTRNDVPDAGFDEFFNLAKFSLWWVKCELNNVCRLRMLAWNHCLNSQAEASAARAWEGLNLTFGLSAVSTTSDVMLSTNEERTCSNIVAVASPDLPGAFRFESAYFPGHYLCFLPPTLVQMQGPKDIGGDAVIDFILMDFSVSEKFRTLDEILIPIVKKMGGDRKPVPLVNILQDTHLNAFFRAVLGKPLWDAGDFEIYFLGHSDRWDFDAEKQVVRVRGQQEKLALNLKRAHSTTEIVRAIEKGTESHMAKLDVGTLEYVWPLLLEASLPGQGSDALVAARTKFLTGVVGILAKDGVDMSYEKLVWLYGKLSILSTAGHDALEPLCEEALRSAVIRAATMLLQPKGDEIKELEVLHCLFQMPLDWKAVGAAAAQKAQKVIALQPLDKLVPLIRAAVYVKAGKFGECLATSSMMKTFGAAPDVAVDALDAMTSGGFGLDGAAMTLRMQISRAPLPPSASVIATLGNHGATGEDFRACCDALAAHPGMGDLPVETLLRLLTAARKTPTVAVAAHAAVCRVCSVLLASGSFSFEEAVKALQAVTDIPRAETKSSEMKADADADAEDEDDDEEDFENENLRSGRTQDTLSNGASELISAKLPEVKISGLLAALAALSERPACSSLLESITAEAARRAPKLPASQLEKLTRALLPLGDGSPHLRHAFDAWEQALASDDGSAVRMSADELAKLAELLSPVEPCHGVYERLAQRLIDQADKLTAAGVASVEAAFPDERPEPSFESKGKLLRAARRRRDRRGRDRDRERSRSRGRGTSELAIIVKGAERDRDRDRDRDQKHPYKPGKRVIIQNLGRKLDGQIGIVVQDLDAAKEGRIAVRLDQMGMVTWVSPSNLK